MSYQYSDADQHEALYNLARRYPGGITALAAALSQRQGKTVTVAVLRNKLRPGIATHHVTFEDLSLIVELCEEAGVVDAHVPLAALCWRHDLVAVPLPKADPDDDNPTATVCRVMKEVGEVAAAVSRAAADGVITDSELDEIEREFLHAQAALASWRSEIRRRAASNKRRGTAIV